MSQERPPSRDERFSRLMRVGELELTGDNEAEVDAYFAPDFVFHGPDGAELDYKGLKGYFASLRAAFVPWLSVAIYIALDVAWLVPDRRIERVLSLATGDGE